ncbi:glycoside hydrolase family 9 protein [Vibrio tapetis subsp. quintayensis]|uniref:glycoside hydrolase family 9 protein n=1 Tax=Vibrio tapetis TaxID=52443 RepID=UPI0025B316D9|nr:glycoside hydrolase family 9 protein [Vibrio tapetis]MDN3681498.1 glycoside hydrolase family 9 protein [Vibrio tapetis subsp. quintayensis]
MQLFTNQIGYEVIGSKQAVLLLDSDIASALTAELVCSDTLKAVQELHVQQPSKVSNWHQGLFSVIDFSQVEQAGRYFIRVGETCSHSFEIGDGILMQRTFSDLLHYFKSQRCGGIFDQQDGAIPLLGTDQTADVGGGWYDASGDVSKYLSHLSYSNFLNPQQTPMVVWNMLKGLAVLEDCSDFSAFSRVRLSEEALFGADFLVRMQHSEGYFYLTVFDKWSKDVKQREICAYETQDGHKTADYQAGFRQGGGVSIAALAAAARLDTHGEYDQQQYLEAATRGYWHLKENNTQYLDDGIENIIDDYCALLAAVELYRTTKDSRYLTESRFWADKLASRQHCDDAFNHYWSANQDGSRPYFHAAEAGLPVIALCEYLSIESNAQNFTRIQTVVSNAIEFELNISSTVPNPFGYPRQYVKSVTGQKRDAFFVAHENESGYWWQGENARLGSLASMAFSALPYLDNSKHSAVNEYAQQCLNWIVGLNPYDMCMLDGHGHNNPDYLPQLGFFNAKGGVCNGITGGFDDENDIAFNPPKQKDDMLQNWRWGEQWIPHGAWLLLAVMTQFHSNETTKENCNG